MPPFACFNCCLGEEGGKTVEVVSTLGSTPGDEGEFQAGSKGAITKASDAKPAAKEPAKAASPSSPASAKTSPRSAGSPVNPDDVLNKSRKLGAPCRKRMPKPGDVVMSMSGKKVGHDHKGNAKAWILMPGQPAEVLEVDADGDFRLRNLSGVESGFLFRKEFAYAIDPDLPETAGRTGSMPMLEAAKQVSPPFDLKLNKTAEDQIGLRVDTMCPYHLEINEVSDGIIKKHNATADPDRQVQEGYFVIGVNGKPCLRDLMLSTMKQTGEINLRIAPNEEFKVSLKKTSKVGLVLLVEPLCRSLLVSKVSVGCVDDYNATAPEHLQVKENDRIVEVNGVRGDPNKMLELTRTDAAELTLVVSRPVMS